MPEQSEQDLHTMTAILKTLDLFKELNEQENQAVIKKITLQYFPENYILFKEGDFADKMYIIKTGMVRIYKPGASASFDTEISMLGDNDIFGEMALISEAPRNATAKVMEPSQIFVLAKGDLLQLISENPSIAAKISTEFLGRLKKNLKDKD